MGKSDLIQVKHDDEFEHWDITFKSNDKRVCLSMDRETAEFLWQKLTIVHRRMMSALNSKRVYYQKKEAQNGLRELP